MSIFLSMRLTRLHATLLKHIHLKFREIEKKIETSKVMTKSNIKINIMVISKSHQPADANYIKVSKYTYYNAKSIMNLRL